MAETSLLMLLLRLPLHYFRWVFLQYYPFVSLLSGVASAAAGATVVSRLCCPALAVGTDRGIYICVCA